jgi:uncharacterized protein DUF4124
LRQSRHKMLSLRKYFLNQWTLLLVYPSMNTRILLLVLSITLSTIVVAETVYKTRDAEGNIIFSDVPSEGAETIEIEEAQTISIPEPKRIGDRPTTKLVPEETDYSQLKIITPENDATIRSNEGIVNINVEITPELDEEHVLVFLLDDEEVSSGKSLQYSSTNLDRGTHSITVEVKNEKDKVLKRSDKQVFHLHKQSKLFKNRVNTDSNTADTTIIGPESSGSGESAPTVSDVPPL